MNDIETYLDQACTSINGPDELRQHLRQELKEHLGEAIEALVAEGVSKDEATHQAIEGLGAPESIRDGMESVYNPGVTSLFVDKAIGWRDRKWHIAAQLGLALIFSTGIGCVTFMLFFIVPKLQAIHEYAGIEINAYLEAAVGFSGMVVKYKWLCLLGLTGGLGLFEWKCRRENKAHLRTAIGVSLSLLSVCASFWIIGVVAVTATLLASHPRPAPVPISKSPVPYGNHYYQVIQEVDVEWKDAKARCETLGGYLVVINDSEENAFLASIGAGNLPFHLGASDAENEGDWRWIDGSPMTWQNWDEGEPNDNPSRYPKNYLSAHPRSWPAWTAGRSRAQGFICEWDHRPESIKQQQEDQP